MPLADEAKMREIEWQHNDLKVHTIGFVVADTPSCLVLASTVFEIDKKNVRKTTRLIRAEKRTVTKR